MTRRINSTHNEAAGNSIGQSGRKPSQKKSIKTRNSEGKRPRKPTEALTIEVIKGQISRLVDMPLSELENSPAPSLALAKEELPDGSGSQVFLGIYAKWLIALDEAWSLHPRQKAKTNGSRGRSTDFKDDKLATISFFFDKFQSERRVKDYAQINKSLRNLFIPSCSSTDFENRNLPSTFYGSGNKYQVKSYSQRQYRTRESWPAAILNAVLSKINEIRKGSSASELYYSDFIDYKIIIPANSLAVGTEPIAHFREWLKSNLSPVSNNKAPDSQITIESNPYQSYFSNNQSPVLDNTHKVITNIHFDSLHVPTRNDFECVKEAIRSEQPRAGIIEIPLEKESTPRTVIDLLCRGLLPDNLANETISSTKNRPINYAIDLLKVRSALSRGRAQPIFLLFYGWDNSDGKYRALHSYMSNSSWGEMLRILAQPERQVISISTSAPKPPFNIVVLSSAPVESLVPWAEQRLGVQNTPQAGEQDAPNSTDSPEAIFSSYISNLNVNQTSAVMMTLVAASVNGLRLTTLKRCVRNYINFRRGSSSLKSNNLDADKDSSFWSSVQSTLDTYDRWLCLSSDENDEGITDENRSVELNSLGRDYDNDLFERFPESVAPPSNQIAKTAIKFKTRRLHLEFVSKWQSNAATFNYGHEKIQIGKVAWLIANHILAEEFLAQASSQALHLGLSNRESPASLRKFMLATYHGLASTDSTLKESVQSNTSANTSPISIPLDALDRWLYCYKFIYKNCIERNSWQFGRSFGKSEVRLDLLSIFFDVSTARDLLAGGQASQKNASTNNFSIQSLSLKFDVLVAIARAGLDVGSSAGRKATNESLKALDKLSQTARKGKYIHLYNKISLDYFQSDGSSENLLDARRTIIEILKQEVAQDVDNQLSELNASIFNEISKCYTQSDSNVGQITNKLFTAVSNFAVGAASRDSLQYRSDLLYRLGEVYGTEADNIEARIVKTGSRPRATGRHASDLVVLKAFLASFSAFFLADRLRSKAGVSSPMEKDWPITSLRPSRYYVRVLYKLARKVLACAAPNPVGTSVFAICETLMTLGHNRLRMLIRHSFRLDRERATLLQLESVRIRATCRYEISRQSISCSDAFELNCKRYAIHKKVGSQVSKSYSLQSTKIDLDGFLKKTQHEIGQLVSTNQTLDKNASPDVVKVIANRLWRKKEEQRILLEMKFDVESKISNAPRKHLITEIRPTLDSLDVKIAASYIIHIRKNLEVLKVAQFNLSESESLVLASGAQEGHLRRLHLEYIKLSSTIAKLLTSLPIKKEPPTEFLESADFKVRQGAYAKSLAAELLNLSYDYELEKYIALAKLSVDTLASVSSSVFWKQISGRQKISFEWIQQRFIAFRMAVSNGHSLNDFMTE